MEWQKRVANHGTIKGLVSKIYKKLVISPREEGRGKKTSGIKRCRVLGIKEATRIYYTTLGT